MARGELMLQLEVAQDFDSGVTVPPLSALVFDTLDGDTTVVREIAVQKAGGIAISGNIGIDISDNAFGRVWLVFPRQEPKKLNAPSHVSSPPIEGAGLVILQVIDIGGETESNFSFARSVGAHVYLEEVKPGIVPQPDMPAPDTGPVVG